MYTYVVAMDSITDSARSLLKAGMVILGDEETGKTQLIRQHMTSNRFDVEMYTETYELNFLTTEGPITFNVWDTAGQEKFGGPCDGYYIRAQCAIIMFDITSRITYKNVPNWYRDLLQVCGNIPIILCANNVDENTKAKTIAFQRKMGLHCCYVNTANGYNCDEPFVELARRLTGTPSLELIN